MVIDPYGRITSEGKINEKGITVGETFVTHLKTIYTRFGDWFGWAILVGMISLVSISFIKK
jgi:apolipoprotein N-acyltransferase